VRACLKGSAIQVMLASEHLPRNTLNINSIYTRKLGQSITCLSLPLPEERDDLIQDGIKVHARLPLPMAVCVHTSTRIGGSSTYGVAPRCASTAAYHTRRDSDDDSMDLRRGLEAIRARTCRGFGEA